ncbi:MAG: DUF87 domain-containing protein, partial [Alphaproteobacteria bacterium]
MQDRPHASPSAADASLRAAAAASRILGEIVEVSGGDCVCQFSDDARFATMTESGLGNSFTGQMGSFVKVAVGERWVFGVIRALRAAGTGKDTPLFAEIDFAGEMVPDAAASGGQTFLRGITRYPMPGQQFASATLEDLQAIFAPHARAHLVMGTVYPTDVVHASLLIDPLLSRHFAVLGSTGTGKSSAVALLIHRLVEQAPHGHVVILDPHDEYGQAFQASGIKFDTDTLNIPYWLFNFEEHVELLVGADNPDKDLEADILNRVLLVARRKGKPQHQAQRITVDTPVPYLMSDLLAELNRAMGKLDKPERLAPYLRLKAKIEELKADPRYGFMFSGVTISDEMPQILARLLRFPTEGRPVSVLDLSGVPSDIVEVVVSVLARLVFDFALWSRFDGGHPILLVCEEAHRYVPEDTSSGFRAAKRVLDRIAKEGRKYGVSLGLVSQRPADISESVLSQCGTILAMRMNNERDQHFVERAMPEGTRGLLGA